MRSEVCTNTLLFPQLCRDPNRRPKRLPCHQALMGKSRSRKPCHRCVARSITLRSLLGTSSYAPSHLPIASVGRSSSLYPQRQRDNEEERNFLSRQPDKVPLNKNKEPADSQDSTRQKASKSYQSWVFNLKNKSL
jgi:hypothetical protein